jgi:hypothetical protein
VTTGGKPLNTDLIASYMSSGAAQGVFGQRLSDDPAYVTMAAGGGGYTQQDLRDMRWNPPEREEELSEAWDRLGRAECEGEQTAAVMELTEMIFGDPPPDPILRRRREIRSWGGRTIRVVQEDV